MKKQTAGAPKVAFNLEDLQIFINMVDDNPECDIVYQTGEDTTDEFTGKVKEVNLESKEPFVVFKNIDDFKLPLKFIVSVNNIRVKLIR